MNESGFQKTKPKVNSKWIKVMATNFTAALFCYDSGEPVAFNAGV